MNTTNFISYNLFSDELSNITIDKRLIFSTLNSYSFLIAERDNDFKCALQESDILLPDGQGVVWAAKFLYGKKIKKIAGHDIFIFLMNYLNENNGSCFFLGSSEETLLKIKNRLSSGFSNTKVGIYSPPFKDKFNDDENKTMIDNINTFGPDVLFVGMSAPKQEKWVFDNKDKLKVSTIASVGAVFDFYAGNVKRPSKFWIDLGLEWLIRFLQEPRRLFKRNLYSIIFIIKILKAKAGKQF